MEVYVFKSNGKWYVDFTTNQPEMPCILNDYIKDAVKAAVEKFNNL